MSSHSCFPSPRQPHVFESPDARNGAYATAPPPARLAPGAPPTPRPTCNDRLTQPRDRSDTKTATLAARRVRFFDARPTFVNPPPSHFPAALLLSRPIFSVVPTPISVLSSSLLTGHTLSVGVLRAQL